MPRMERFMRLLPAVVEKSIFWVRIVVGPDTAMGRK